MLDSVSPTLPDEIDLSLRGGDAFLRLHLEEVKYVDGLGDRHGVYRTPHVPVEVLDDLQHTRPAKAL